MLPDLDRWPHREFSRAVLAADLDWHVQIMGARGPVVVLLHGTGAATHSWRWVAPLLASSCTVVVPDLPGHGFTSRPSDPAGLSIRGMASRVNALLDALALDAMALGSPAIVVGHSAGAVVALQMARSARVIGINAALGVPPFMRHPWLAAVARGAAVSPLTAYVAAGFADVPGAIDAILSSTGSVIPEAQRALYRHLLRSPARMGAVLAMMARWDLAAFREDVPTFPSGTVLIAATNDRWVPPEVAIGARVHIMTGVGHLAHEERPEEVTAIILDALPAPTAPPSNGRP